MGENDAWTMAEWACINVFLSEVKALPQVSTINYWNQNKIEKEKGSHLSNATVPPQNPCAPNLKKILAMATAIIFV